MAVVLVAWRTIAAGCVMMRCAGVMLTAGQNAAAADGRIGIGCLRIGVMIVLVARTVIAPVNAFVCVCANRERGEIVYAKIIELRQKKKPAGS